MTRSPISNDYRQVIQQILQGKLNNTGTLTLTANQTTTVIVDSRTGVDSVVLLMPATANAAAEQTFITTSKEEFTVNHANASTTDRSFNYAIIG